MHFHALPKGAMRIINAAQIQADYNKRRREREEQEASKTRKGQETDRLQIRKGERLPDFHRYVQHRNEALQGHDTD